MLSNQLLTVHMLTKSLIHIDRTLVNTVMPTRLDNNRGEELKIINFRTHNIVLIYMLILLCYYPKSKTLLHRSHSSQLHRGRVRFRVILHLLCYYWSERQTKRLEKMFHVCMLTAKIHPMKKTHPIKTWGRLWVSSKQSVGSFSYLMYLSKDSSLLFAWST